MYTRHLPLRQLDTTDQLRPIHCLPAQLRCKDLNSPAPASTSVQLFRLCGSVAASCLKASCRQQQFMPRSDCPEQPRANKQGGSTISIMGRGIMSDFALGASPLRCTCSRESSCSHKFVELGRRRGEGARKRARDTRHTTAHLLEPLFYLPQIVSP